MNAAYERLRDSLPGYEGKPDADAGASDARSLREWLDALPMLNFATAASRLGERLDVLNRQQLAPAKRLELLELLRAPVAQLDVALARQIVAGGLALAGQDAGPGEAALSLQAGLALGYRRALGELTAPAGAVPFLRGKLAAQAAVRALQHGAAQLRIACLLYRAPPRGAWQALHAVHSFAAASRLDGQAVDDALDGGRVANAAAAYVGALLFALVNPYHFVQAEQLRVAELMEAMAPYGVLSARNDDERSIVIPVEEDRGPGYLVQERAAGGATATSLQLERVFAFADECMLRSEGLRQVEVRRGGGAPLQLDVGLFQRVLASLGTPSERGHARIGGVHELRTVIGLHDLHGLLVGGEDFGRFAERAESAAPVRDGVAAGGGPGAAMAGADAPAIHVARVLDQALGGYRILWPPPARGDAVQARIGDLIGLALPATDEARNDWMLGVIRWFRIVDGGATECGVELLARRPLPVAVRPRQGVDSAVQRGLLLSPLDGAPGAGYSALLVASELGRAVQPIEIDVPPDTLGPASDHRRIIPDPHMVLDDGDVYRIIDLTGTGVLEESGA